MDEALSVISKQEGFTVQNYIWKIIHINGYINDKQKGTQYWKQTGITVKINVNACLICISMEPEPDFTSNVK